MVSISSVSYDLGERSVAVTYSGVTGKWYTVYCHKGHIQIPRDERALASMPNREAYVMKWMTVIIYAMIIGTEDLQASDSL